MKKRPSKSYTPGGSPSEPSLPRHVRKEDLPSLPTSGTRATSTPATAAKTQSITRRVFVYTPKHPSSLNQEITRVEKHIVKKELRVKTFFLVDMK
ncbi:hypothetical protein O181_015137 [Austropuccinia psidii MF-1]|uniref:Uncharacterized protein n=1 Tax=Austropuccinia psidii MF-1 TaxID=1389203 RepID=A0A9Q3GQH7_9BASI|nr:hypothetical protein [Austropuccinia psidii MF-1]